MNERTAPKKKFTSWLTQRFTKEPKNREDLVELIRDSEQHALIAPDIKNMLEGVMDIAEQRVRDIMIPRSQLITLNLTQSLDECLDVIRESTHSRYPVIHEDKDHVAGLLLAKDLLIHMHDKGRENFNLSEIIRPAVIVPESKHVDQMLKEFRAQRYHMAIVIDEFGGVSGLVTIEDVLELIVGDIEDEYDDEANHPIRQIASAVFNVHASMPIDEFNHCFSTSLSEDNVDTIGGFILKAFGRLPKRGESIVLNHYVFKVGIVDSNRIIQLTVTLPDNTPTLVLD